MRPSRQQLVRAGLAAATIGVVVAAGFGVGYRASGTVLDNAGAFVPKGHTVAYVNAESGTAEAQAARDLAQKRQRLEVVTVAPGVAYVVNNETNEVWRLSGDTMRPEAVDPPPPSPTASATEGGGTGNAPNTLHPVTGGGKTYLIDTRHGSLSLIQETQPHVVPVGAPVSDVVVDGSGVAWAFSREQGALYEVTGTQARRHSMVSVPKEPAYLTLAGDRPVILIPDRPGHGIARIVDTGDGGEHPEITLPRHPAGAVQIAKAGADRRVLVAVVQHTDTVVAVDFHTGEESSLRLAGRGDAGKSRSYGRPVVLRDRIYVPDYTNRQVVVLQLRPLAQVETIPVPGKEQFDVFARDGRVWINDQYHRKGTAIDGDRRSDFDKGPGSGVDGTAPSASPSVSQSPPATVSPPSSRPSSPVAATSPPPPVPRSVVPNVIGMDETAACAAIERAQLRCRKPAGTAQRPGCTPGQVIETIQGPGARVPRGSPISIVLCGPTVVPGVVGLPVDQACRAVTAAGLTCVWQVGGVAQNPADRGKVIRQDPAAAASVGPGATVTLAYYDPQQVLVPNVTGIGPQQACETLAAHGFGCQHNPGVVTWQANVVLGQSPGAGAPADPNSTPVRVDYQPNGPSHLYRQRHLSEPIRHLSLTAGFGNWDPQPAMGGVYGGNVVAGLVAVYEYECIAQCEQNRPTGFYYDTNPNALGDSRARWRRNGVAFWCFGGAQAGTVPLWALRSSNHHAWAFAPIPSWEYDHHVAVGAYHPSFPICHIWKGVGPFR